MTNERIIAGLKRFNCPRRLHLEAIRTAVGLKQKLTELEKWIAYQGRKNKRGDYLSDVKVYQIEDGGTHWFAARSEDEAFKKHREIMCMSEEEYKDEFGEWEVTKINGEAPLGIITDEDQTVSVIKSCAEWVFEHIESGRPVPEILCTSEY